MQRSILKYNLLIISWSVLALLVFIWSALLLATRAQAQSILSENNFNLGNEFLSVEVNPLNGNFNLHLPYQTPNRNFSNYHQGRLLFGNPETNTSGTIFTINGQKVPFRPQNIYTENDSLVATQYNYSENYEIKQILTFVESPHTLRKDLLEIKYEFRNFHYGTNLTVGNKITLDVQLNDLDLPYFYDDKYGLNYFTHERQRFKNNLPQYWQAKNSSDSPTLIGEGLFYLDSENNSQKPDNVIFTCQGLSSRYDENTYLSNLRRQKLDQNSACDGVVLIFFAPRALEFAQETTFTTYYGLSDFTTMPTMPSLVAENITSPESLELSNTYGIYQPEIISANLEINNIGYVTANNLTSEIVLPDGLKLPPWANSKVNLGDLYGGQRRFLNWPIQAEPQQFDQNFHYQVLFWADDALVQSVDFNLFVPRMRYRQAIYIIPGIGASKLFEHDDHRSNQDNLLWLQLGANLSSLELAANFAPFTNNIFAGENQYLNYGVFNLYDDLVIALQNAFSRQYEVVFWPYDWRLSNIDTSAKLSTDINKSEYEKVILIGHSMGGLIAMDYWQNYGQDKVEKVIALGTPFYGTPRAAYVLETGNFLGGLLGFIGNIFTHDLVKNLTQNFPAVYELLPSNHYFNADFSPYLIKKDKDFTGQWLISSPTTYQASLEFLQNTWWGRNKASYQFGSRLHERILNNSFLETNRSKLFQFVGYGYGTLAQLEYKPRIDKYQLSDLISIENGDGTVPISSANLGRNDLSSPQILYAHLTHQNLAQDATLIKSLIKIINNQNALETGITYSQPDKTLFGYAKVKIACPVDVIIKNEEQEIIAQVENGYPLIADNDDASTFVIGENNQTKIIFLQNPKINYQIYLSGTGKGQMDYNVDFYDQNGKLINGQFFENISITTDTLIESSIDYRKRDQLLVLNIKDKSNPNQAENDPINETSLQASKNTQSLNNSQNISIFLPKIQKRLQKNITRIEKKQSKSSDLIAHLFSTSSSKTNFSSLNSSVASSQTSTQQTQDSTKIDNHNSSPTSYLFINNSNNNKPYSDDKKTLFFIKNNKKAIFCLKVLGALGFILILIFIRHKKTKHHP